MNRRVALLGGPGAFSEEAAQQLFGTDWTPVPLPNIQDVATAPARGIADAVVMPVVNSIAGGVEEALDGWRAQKLYAFAECGVAVRQCLLALPGVRLEEVREVWSHPHALEQCTPFLRLHGFTPIPTGSTVAGAEQVARRRQRHLASLGSSRTAERLGLSVLAVDVQSVPDNFTRFVALAATPQTVPTGDDKTSLAFDPKGGAAGLPELLAILQQHDVRLVGVQVRPIASRPWRQSFFVDLLGHAREPPLALVLPKLEERAEAVQWLGSYPARVATA